MYAVWNQLDIRFCNKCSSYLPAGYVPCIAVHRLLSGMCVLSYCPFLPSKIVAYIQNSACRGPYVSEKCAAIVDAFELDQRYRLLGTRATGYERSERREW